MTHRWVYPFSEGNKDMRALLGGKGANLAEMTQLQLPVPPGFIITTEACNVYLKAGQQFPPNLWDQVKSAIRQLEAQSGKKLNSPDRPLIVSVRSGAAISMPGILETILNVGLTTRIVKKLAGSFDQSQFAYDSYLRLIQMFGRIVHSLDLDLGELKGDPSLADIESLLKAFQEKTGVAFPQDPYVQLQQAISAVFDSWLAPKAVEYRASYQIPDDLDTAVVVQAMVFGNMGTDSGTGIIFTRNPSTGERQLFGEYLLAAQGEDVATGIRTPQKIEGLAKDHPEAYRQLSKICNQLEMIYRDVQDIEFTVERGKLWILQTRAAELTPLVTIKVAVDMTNEGVLSKAEAIQRVDLATISRLLSRCFEDASPENALAQGIASSPGAAVGRIALSQEQVEELASSGDPIIFVRENTSPDDVPIMPWVAGVLTQHGGATSHAAVVARGLGKPCVVGCEALEIDLEQGELRIGSVVILQGEFISIDGNTGLVFEDAKRLTGLKLEEGYELATLLKWADEINETQIFANANTPAEIEFACSKGTKAIGLCRTEWMFHDVAFRSVFRESLLAESELERNEALQQLQQLQTHEFESMFTKARETPVIVRLLAAPVDDFLPVRDAIVTELAELQWSEGWNELVGYKEQLLQRMSVLQQVNPRFGRRGARLFFAMPEFATMQVCALFEGACRAAVNSQKTYPHPWVLLPNVSSAVEVSAVKHLIREIAMSIMQKNGVQFSYQVGALIETPRAAITAGEIAPLVDFVCLGTDALTETVFGYAREDGNKFIPAYVSQDVLPNDPLMWFDATGVGALIQIAVQEAREACPDIVVGIYGSHVYDIGAIHFYSKLNLDYVCADMSHSLDLRLALAQARTTRG